MEIQVEGSNRKVEKTMERNALVLADEPPVRPAGVWNAAKSPSVKNNENINLSEAQA